MNPLATLPTGVQEELYTYFNSSNNSPLENDAIKSIRCTSKEMREISDSTMSRINEKYGLKLSKIKAFGAESIVHERLHADFLEIQREEQEYRPCKRALSIITLPCSIPLGITAFATTFLGALLVSSVCCCIGHSGCNEQIVDKGLRIAWIPNLWSLEQFTKVGCYVSNEPRYNNYDEFEKEVRQSELTKHRYEYKKISQEDQFH